jgi:beta-N-acetylhexosaminidase
MESGQRLLIGFDGTEMDSELERLIRDFRIGGVILFSRNILSPEQVARLCSDIQSMARRHSLPPLFIAIDQEGGRVARLKAPGFTEFPGNPYLQSRKDVARFCSITAQELHQIGVNMDLAPVIDVVPPGIDGIMAERVFGEDPDWVAAMGAAMIDGLQQNGIMAVAKHFPGIGRTVLDSHLDLPDLDISPAELENSDLVPFSAAIRHGVTGIMLSHIRYLSIDSYWPASLSPTLARDLLRRKMGYEGLVMTDDLDMGAISGHFSLTEAVSQAVLAEVDQIMICRNGPSVEQAAAILAEMEQNRPHGKDMAVQRILRVKAEWLDGPGLSRKAS